MGSAWFRRSDWRPLGVPSDLHGSVILQAWPYTHWSQCPTSHKVPQPSEAPSQVYFQTWLFQFPISLFYFPSCFSSEMGFCSLVHADHRTDIVQTGIANLPEVSALQAYSSAGWCIVDLYMSHSCVTVLAKVSFVRLGLWNDCTSAHTMQRSSSVRRGMNEADSREFCALWPKYPVSLNMWVYVTPFPGAETAVPACYVGFLMRCSFFVIAVTQIWDSHSTEFLSSYYFFILALSLPTCL